MVPGGKEIRQQNVLKRGKALASVAASFSWETCRGLCLARYAARPGAGRARRERSRSTVPLPTATLGRHDPTEYDSICWMHEAGVVHKSTHHNGTRSSV